MFYQTVAVAYSSVKKDDPTIVDKVAVGLYLMLLVNPVLRLAGLISQTNRQNSLIPAQCVGYSFTTMQLYVTPFNLKCLTNIDMSLLTSKLI